MYTGVEVSPLDVVMLGLILENKFCDKTEYRPEVCSVTDPHCTICRDLLIKTGGHA